MKARDLAAPIALLVLAVGALVYAYVFDTNATPERSRSNGASDVFPNFRVDEVTSIELVHGGETLILERSDRDNADSWALSSPTRARADSAAVDLLLRELDLATQVRSVRESDAIGLGTPRVIGRVTMGKRSMALRGADYSFALGADTIRPEGSAYFRIDGQGTFVVNRSLKVQLLRGADAYRDRTLVPIGVNDVGRIILHTPGDPGVILEPVHGEFRIADSGLRASRASVDRMLSAITEGRVEVFAPTRGAVDPTTTIVELIGRESKHGDVTLEIGGPCPVRPDGIFVERTHPWPMAGCVPATMLSALEVPAGGWSDSSVFFAHADEIEELRLEALGSPSRTVDIARKDRGWRERAPSERTLTSDEAESASELASALADSTAVDVKRAAPDEPFEPKFRVAVVRTGGGKTEVVELSGPRADTARRARRLDDGAWLMLPLETARRFEPHSASLRGLAVWREALRPSSIVGIDDRCGPQVQRLERVDGVWFLRAPQGIRTGSTIVEGLLEELLRTKAESWVAERDDGTFGLAGPQACAVAFSMDDGRSSIRRTSLRFGADAPHGVYARNGDDPAVFVMQKSIRNAFASPLVDSTPSPARTGERDSEPPK